MFENKGRTLLCGAPLLPAPASSFWPFAIRHVDNLYAQSHSTLVRPSVVDDFTFGQELETTIRKWKNTFAAFEPLTEKCIWLGRDLSLSGDGGILYSYVTENVRHGATFANPRPLVAVEAIAVDAVCGEPGEKAKDDRNVKSRLRKKHFLKSHNLQNEV